jgi:photosystem II stability/assembly factor-like uncharacterized protein
MKTLISILLALFCITNANAQITWTKIEIGKTNLLNDVIFPVDINKGFIIGNNGLLLQTLDGAKSFDTLQFYTGTDNQQLMNSMQIVSLDFNTVFLSVDDKNPYSYNKIFKTTNSGITWQSINKSSLYAWCDNFYRITFPINNSQGYIIIKSCPNGNYTGVMKTLDGGLTGSGTNFTLAAQLNDICFIDNKLGFVVGTNGLIERTQNSGTNVETINWKGNDKTNLTKVRYLDQNNTNIWFIIGENGLILKSIDGGTNWLKINTGLNKNLTDISFSNNGKIGFITGEEGLILSTTNQGDSWTSYYYPSKENLSSVSIPPNQDKVAYIVGSNGTILKSNNITDVKDNISCKCDFSISPNPATYNISIYFTNSELSNSSISIFNSLGIEMKFKPSESRQPSEGYSINISTEDFPSGVYYCTYSTGINRRTKSFVVVR